MLCREIKAHKQTSQPCRRSLPAMETAEINHLPQSFVLFTFQIPLEWLHLSHQKPYGHDAGPCSKQILHFPSQAVPHICLLTRNSWKGWIFFNRVCVCVREIKRFVIEREEEWLRRRKDAYEDLLYLTHLCFFSFSLISERRLAPSRFPKRRRVISKRLPPSCR